MFLLTDLLGTLNRSPPGFFVYVAALISSTCCKLRARAATIFARIFEPCKSELGKKFAYAYVGIAALVTNTGRNQSAETEEVEDRSTINSLSMGASLIQDAFREPTAENF